MTDTKLKSFFERIEKLSDEKKNIQDDIKEVYNEAKNEGYDTKIMRKVIALRKMPENERQELEQLIETYMSAI